MTIQRVNKDTIIKPGQWVNKATLSLYGICRMPVLVTKVSGNRIYYQTDGDDYDGKYCDKVTIAFVSDTKEEADALYEANKAQEAAIHNAMSYERSKFRGVVDDLIAGSVK